MKLQTGNNNIKHNECDVSDGILLVLDIIRNAQ